MHTTQQSSSVTVWSGALTRTVSAVLWCCAVLPQYDRDQLMLGGARPGEIVMAVLRPCSPSFAQQLCDREQVDPPWGGRCVVSCINSATEVVIAGDGYPAYQAMQLGKAGIGESRLTYAAMVDVAGAFHSPIQNWARERMERQIAALHITRPCVPTMSNVTGQPVNEVEEIRALTLEHFTAPCSGTSQPSTALYSTSSPSLRCMQACNWYTSEQYIRITSPHTAHLPLTRACFIWPASTSRAIHDISE